MSIVFRRRFILGAIAVAAVFIVGAIVLRVFREREANEQLRMGILAAKSARTHEAIDRLDRVLRIRPQDPRALLYRAQLAREAGDVDLSLELLRRVSEEHPVEAGTARYFEATICLERRRAREAEELLLRSIALHPSYVQSRERLSQLYVVQARGMQIREALEGVRQIRRLTLDELVQFSDASAYLYNAADNVPFLEECIAADSGDRESLIALARYRIASGTPVSANAPLETGLARWPEDPRFTALLAELRLVQDRPTDAATLLARFPNGETCHPEICRSRGLLAFVAQEWDLAAECLERACLAIPDDLTMAYKLGHAWERLGLQSSAQKLLERTRAMDQAYLSVFRIRKGNRERLDLLVPVLREIAETLLSLERLSEAAAWIDEARGLLPGDVATGKIAAEIEEARAATSSDYEEFRNLVESARKERHLRPAQFELPSDSGGRSAGAADAQVAVGSRIRLRDVHAEAGVSFQYFTGESEFHYLIETLGGAVAAFDYDGDGWPDLYFPQGGNVPGQVTDRTDRDRLFRNRGDGKFEDVTEQAGLGDTGYSQGCTAGDIDNDGDLDLIVANFGTNVIYQNEGDGTFTDVTRAAGIAGEHWTSSLALADFDNDGDLDLYVVTYVLEALKVCKTPDGTMSTCSPGNFPAEDDILYLNLGDGRFADVSAEAGILAPDGKGLGIVVADFDDDHRLDIYVANDGAPNFLFRNLGVNERGIPRFEEMALVAGCAVSADGASQAGMGIACADMNDDGRLDLYVTNFYLEHNALYLNDGEMQFRDASRAAGLVEITRPLLGFGTQAIDFDLDGRFELITANGHIDDYSFRGEPWKMPPQLLRSGAKLRFVDISAEAGEFFQVPALGRGLSRVDWNRDGRPDAIIVNQDLPAALLLNDTESTGHWLGLELRGVASNRDAIGTRIRFTCGSVTRTIELCGGDGYFAVNDRRQILGLGPATHVDRLEVTWPNGAVQVWEDIPAEQVVLLREGATAMFQSPM